MSESISFFGNEKLSYCRETMQCTSSTKRTVSLVLCLVCLCAKPRSR